MLSERELKDVIEKIISEIKIEETPAKETPVTVMEEKTPVVSTSSTYDQDENPRENPHIVNGEVRDIGKINVKEQMLVDNPEDREEYMKLKQKTSARLGIGRAGTRMRTEVLLRLRADHAAAQDAVFNDVPTEFLDELGLFEITTECESRDQYITRPDLGRKISQEGIKIIEEKCKKNPTVQIVVSDGLSSTAIEANAKNIIPAMLNGLKGYGIDTGTPFFIKYGRVGAGDHVGEILNADFVCILIGERPGLTTAESMSAYITYKARPGISEAKRTVVSNIHKDGTPSAEAGAHVATLIKKIIDAKASGQDLKL